MKKLFSYTKEDEDKWKEIELRLPKDVSYFTALSGGIDSSVLGYFISNLKPKTQTMD